MREPPRGTTEGAGAISTLPAADRAWRAAESRYRALFDDNPAGLFRSTVAGQLLECNDAFARIFGYDSRSELEGGSTTQLYFAAAERERFLDELCRRGAVDHFEERLRTKSGSELFVLTAARLFEPTEAGSESLIQGSVLDITPLRRAEEALRESEEHSRDLVENSLVLMCTQDLDGNLLSVNEAASELTGYSREALLRMNVADLLAPDVRNRFGEYMTTLLDKGRASGLMKVLTASGETRYWEFSNTLRTRGVSVPLVRGIARDVTAARLASAKLRESEAKYRTLVEHIGEGLLLVDRDETILFANPAVCRMLGYSEAELLGQNATGLLFRERDRPAMKERNRRCAAGIAEGYEIEVRRSSGECRWTWISAAPVTDADGKYSGTMSIIADITERKLNEALAHGQRRVLEMIAGGAPLEEILTALLRVLESQFPEMLCSVLLLDPDGERLRHGAAPSLPEEYVRAIDGVAIGPCVGSCGTAAFRCEPVIVDNIANDSLWQSYRDLALPHGLRACWSTPIFDAQKRVLGTFAIYYREPSRPTAQHLRLIDNATQTAAIAISHARSEAALRLSEAQLRSFIEHAPADIAMFDNRMVCLAASQRWIDAYSRGRPTPVGISHYEVNPDLPERWKEVHRRGLAGESQTCSEDMWVRTDGTSQWLRWSVDPWHDPKGAIGGIVLFLEDITARKQAQEAFLSEKALSEAMIDSLPGILLLSGRTGRLLRWNRALETASGHTAAEIAHLQPVDFFAQEDRARVEETIRRVFDRGNADMEAALIAKDGRRIPYYLTGVRIVAEGKPCCIAAGIDLSARKLLEAQLQQAQKIEAIGRLAGGVAHDFNNILGVILGYGELVASELEPGTAASEQVAEMVKAAERGATLTRQLQAFSRMSILQPKRLDLNDVVANAHKMLGRLIREDIVLVLRPAPDLAAVRADPGQIDQVLINLAVNARDAMPGGGTLTLATANVDLDEAYVVDHGPAKPGRYVMLAVSDTGVGMDAETQRRIFEPFFTTKPVGQGTGLGLAMVYGIVKQSDGCIWVYSEPGLGTTFKIYLPRIDEPPESPELLAPAGPSEIALGGHESILIVEDNPALRETIRRKLEGVGYRVLLAGDGEEALALVGARPESIDLLLTDVVMPKLGGGELARQVRTLWPGIHVLFMSGYTDGAIAQHGILQDGVVLLEKPFSGAKLLRAVRTALDPTAS